jgi:hypothetical protein
MKGNPLDPRRPVTAFVGHAREKDPTIYLACYGLLRAAAALVVSCGPEHAGESLKCLGAALRECERMERTNAD